MRCFMVLFALFAGALAPTVGVLADEPFEPTVKSLERYKCPEWFRDAKFGIYMHWGVCFVELLGHAGKVQWEAHPDGLRVTFPEKKPCDFAYCLKIHLPKK